MASRPACSRASPTLSAPSSRSSSRSSGRSSFSCPASSPSSEISGSTRPAPSLHSDHAVVVAGSAVKTKNRFVLADHETAFAVWFQPALLLVVAVAVLELLHGEAEAGEHRVRERFQDKAALPRLFSAEDSHGAVAAEREHTAAAVASLQARDRNGVAAPAEQFEHRGILTRGMLPVLLAVSRRFLPLPAPDRGADQHRDHDEDDQQSLRTHDGISRIRGHANPAPLLGLLKNPLLNRRDNDCQAGRLNR